MLKTKPNKETHSEIITKKERQVKTKATSEIKT